MNVKFDLVRFGKIRKNNISELILKKNVEFLQNHIRFLLDNENIDNKNNCVDMVMIIPGRGYEIKIALQDIRDTNVKKILKVNIPLQIYKGDYSIIIDNINNRIF
mgnify:FL=1|jgi:cobalamin biosynthesis Co2+ chelatase CbiK|tara:strand:- start:254 stop:568 length:315 start_codon:yes stop_codon:yes gene_type:complete